jgi:hypothetical protein
MRAVSEKISILFLDASAMDSYFGARISIFTQHKTMTQYKLSPPNSSNACMADIHKYPPDGSPSYSRAAEKCKSLNMSLYMYICTGLLFPRHAMYTHSSTMHSAPGRQANLRFQSNPIPLYFSFNYLNFGNYPLFSLLLKHDVSETGFCLYLQAEPTHMGPLESFSVSGHHDG